MPGSVVGAARLVRSEALCFVCMVEVVVCSNLVGCGTGDSFDAHGSPNRIVCGASGGEQPAITAQGNLVCDVAIQGREGVDRFSAVGSFAFGGQRSQFEFRTRQHPARRG